MPHPCFDVNTDNVVLIQRSNRCALSLHNQYLNILSHYIFVHPWPSNQRRDSAQQVDCRDHYTLNSKTVVEGRHVRGAAQSPQPNIGGRFFTGRHAGSVDGMVGK